jgi:hypothetical protein
MEAVAEKLFSDLTGIAPVLSLSLLFNIISLIINWWLVKLIKDLSKRTWESLDKKTDDLKELLVIFLKAKDENVK